MLKNIEEFREVIILKAKMQLGFHQFPAQFKYRLAGHDPKRFKLAIEFYEETSNPPLRLRVYILLGMTGFFIAPFRLYEDMDHTTGPEDEVYVSDVTVDGVIYNMLSSYFKVIDETDVGLYYNVLLGNALTEPLKVDESFYLLY